MFQASNLTGKRFGRLIVIEQAGRTKSRSVLWKCKCDCGNEKIISADHLRKGSTKSCGCFMAEARVSNNTTHGLSHTSLYQNWRSMKARCTLPSQKSYPRYGGRGITVCREWMNSFENYYNYVSNLPHFGEKGYTLDRIDNDGNYEPGNVRWSTKKEQANNRHTKNRWTSTRNKEDCCNLRKG